MAFEEYGKLHDLVERYAGPRAARATFWMIFIALWCAGLAAIGLAVRWVALSVVLPLITRLPALPLPQAVNLVLSFVLTAIAVTIGGFLLLRTIRTTRENITAMVSFRTSNLSNTVDALTERFDSEVTSLQLRADELRTIVDNHQERLSGVKLSDIEMSGINLGLLLKRVEELESRAVDGASLQAVVQDLEELKADLGALRNSTGTHVGEFAEMFARVYDRMHHIEEAAASVASANTALRALHERLIPVEKPPSDVKTELDLSVWAMKRLLEGPSANSVGHPLVIDEATYRKADGTSIDVRRILEHSIKDNLIRMTVTSTLMGTREVLGGHPKELRVRYFYDGNTKDIVVADGEELKIPD